MAFLFLNFKPFVSSVIFVLPTNSNLGILFFVVLNFKHYISSVSIDFQKILTKTFLFFAPNFKLRTFSGSFKKFQIAGLVF